MNLIVNEIIITLVFKIWIYQSNYMIMIWYDDMIMKMIVNRKIKDVHIEKHVWFSEHSEQFNKQSSHSTFLRLSRHILYHCLILSLSLGLFNNRSLRLWIRLLHDSSLNTYRYILRLWSWWLNFIFLLIVITFQLSASVLPIMSNSLSPSSSTRTTSIRLQIETLRSRV